MGLLKKTAGLLVLTSGLPGAKALALYDPKLCYVLDGFLALYGLFITGMFIKEKFFTTKPSKETEESIYTDLKDRDDAGYAPLKRAGDAESGRERRGDDTYTPLRKHKEDEYKELPVKKERRRNKEQVYQGLSSVTKDTYDKLQMQPLPPR